MPVPVVSLNIYDIGPTTMHVQWQPVGGATGYTVSHQPVRIPEAAKPKEVRDACFLNHSAFLRLYRFIILPILMNQFVILYPNQK